MGKAIPKGYHSVTPHLVVNNAARAIEFYKKAFGAQEIMRMPMGDKIGHAELRIGDSMIMLADEWPGHNVNSPETVGGTTFSMMLYVDNVDATYKQAVAAGAKSTMEPADQFWGDRYGTVVDPFGHAWGIATHVREVSTEEMKKAMDAMMCGEEKAQKAQQG